MDSYGYLRRERFKIVVIGNLYVGKTSLLERYCFEEFGAYRSNVFCEYLTKTVDVFGNEVKLLLWEPYSSIQRFKWKCLTRSFYIGTDCVVIAFDLTNMVSFQDIDSWLKDVRQKTAEACLFVLVGTKADKVNERVVPHEMAQSFAESIGVQYMETSAKTSENVKVVFQSIAEAIMRKKEELKRLANELVDIRQERYDKDRCFGGIMP